MIQNRDPIKKKTKDVSTENGITTSTYESGETFTPAECTAAAEAVTARQGNPTRRDWSSWSEQDRAPEKADSKAPRNPFRP